MTEGHRTMSYLPFTNSDKMEDEGKEDQMKEVFKLKDLMGKKRESRRKKRNKTSTQIISMPLTDLRRISNSKTKEHPMGLKERLMQYLKEHKYKEDIKSKLEEDIKEQNKEDHEGYLKFNEDSSKVNVEDLKQEARSFMKKENKNINLQIPLKKRNKSGIDKNGNIVNSFYKQDNPVPNTLVQPILNLDHIVEKCANEFKETIKNAIVEYAHSVVEPKSRKIVPYDLSDDSQTSTNDEILIPSNESTKSDNQMQEPMNLDIQESNYLKIYLEKETNKNIYRIENDQFKKSHLNEKNQLGKNFANEYDENVIENDKKLEKLTEERYQNLEMGRKIFEKAYRFFDYSEEEENKEDKRRKRRLTNDKFYRRRNSYSRNAKRPKKTKESVAKSHKKSEPEKIEIYIDVEMVNPVDIYLSSIPNYKEYRTEIHVPKSCIKDDPSSDDNSEESEDEISRMQSIEEGEISAKSQTQTEENVKDSHKEEVPDDRIKKDTRNENGDEVCNTPKLKTPKPNTKHRSSKRPDFEKEKSKKEKNRNYQALEEERIQCQRRIDKELEFFRRLPRPKKYLASSSEEFTDDEVFESKNTFTEVRSKAQKSNDTERSSSPIIIYHYYKPAPKPKDELPSLNSDGNYTPELEVENPSNLETSKAGTGPRTTSPQDSASDGEIRENTSEEWEVNKKSLEPCNTLSYNGVSAMKQLENEEVLDPRLQNVNSKISNHFKIQYEPMTITRSLFSNNY